MDKITNTEMDPITHTQIHTPHEHSNTTAERPLDERLKSAELTILELKEQLQKERSDKTGLQEALEAKRKELGSLFQKLFWKNGKINELVRQNKNLEAELEQTRHFNQQLGLRNKEVTGSPEEDSTQILPVVQTLQGNFSEEKEKNRILEEEVQKHREEKAVLQEALEVTRQELGHVSEKVDSLEDDLQQSNAKITCLSQKILSKNEEIDKIQMGNKNLKAELSVCRAELEQTRHLNGQLELKLEAETQELSSLKDALKKMCDRTRDKLQVKNAVLQEEKCRRSACQDMQWKVVQLKQNLQDVSEEKDALEESMKEAEIAMDRINVDLSNCKKELEEVREQRQDLLEEIVQKNQIIDKQQELKSAYEERLGQWRADRKAFYDEQVKLRKQLQKQLKEMRQRNQSLEEQIRSEGDGAVECKTCRVLHTDTGSPVSVGRRRRSSDF
ncbi:interaptin-like [Periophthalmus magnuspinnatus]|uniref:interaptin-like n=1 Tax=Periophthalmus magnuspinnatus TaxID=409849 RepID=UPI0024371608|nr:interaptin-like [Periophthalmus magnuspinnatus]